MKWWGNTCSFLRHGGAIYILSWPCSSDNDNDDDNDDDNEDAWLRQRTHVISYIRFRCFYE